MIVSVQAERKLMAQLDREAEARGLSRSEAIRLAMKRWTAEAMEEDEERVSRAEERHRQLMRRMEFLVGMIREQENREQEKDQKARANGAAAANNATASGGSRKGALGRALGTAAGEGEEVR